MGEMIKWLIIALLTSIAILWLDAMLRGGVTPW